MPVTRRRAAPKLTPALAKLLGIPVSVQKQNRCYRIKTYDDKGRLVADGCVSGQLCNGRCYPRGTKLCTCKQPSPTFPGGGGGTVVMLRQRGKTRGAARR
jgi:hypothetical protein